MIGFLAKRFATIPLVVLGVVTILFIIFKSVPGDEAAVVAGATATQAEIEAVRVQLGLDRPLVEQYFKHISGLVVGDFGRDLRRDIGFAGGNHAGADVGSGPGDGCAGLGEPGCDPTQPERVVSIRRVRQSAGLRR